MDKNYIAWEYDIFEEVTYESMPKKLHPDEDIHVFSKIYSPLEVKEPDIFKEKHRSLQLKNLILIWKTQRLIYLS